MEPTGQKLPEVFIKIDWQIMALFERYENEEEFRNKYIRVLLTRLGFVAVAELHGPREFGKDFVFSEFSPFGFIRHYAAVVKHKNRIRQTSSHVCQEILAQVKQAFSVTFKLPESDTENRASSVVVFNSGKITTNAITWIRSELDEERYGRNVHIFDSERLLQLDLVSTFRQREMLLPQLNGIKTDIVMNTKIWTSILKDLPEFVEARRHFTTALKNYLAAPFLTDRVPQSHILLHLQECQIIERIHARYLTPLSPKGTVRENDINTLKRVIETATARALLILKGVEGAISSFRLLTDDIA